ncbi:chromophore lyase CpcT/CpeT [Parasynechococcus sp.]|uniref:chromophore lyase CpcT/CpeT n=1 Tax=Parasynechococcus sp. TaxID=3101203 RepID=UPI003703EC60
MTSESQALLNFAKTLSGHYSNQNQAQENPKDFAHINIFFRPLPWEILKSPGFYSEQSYDHDPWRPYRQGIHRLKPLQDGVFIVENFGFADPIRLAGAGQRPELLNSLNPESITPRCGCGMHFREIEGGHYRGEVEPGKKCLVPRDGKLTYLVSEVDVNDTDWISRDRGFDPDSDEQRWGSEHGPLRFKRQAYFGGHLDLEWLKW